MISLCIYSKTKINPAIYLLIFLLFFSFWNPKSAHGTEKPLVIKTATLAPSGSPWYELLKEMADEWQKKTNGQVMLRIYPGGVAGSENDIIIKMRIGQLHAAVVSIGGLSRIDPGVNVLAIPMAVDSWEVLEKIRSALCPHIEKSLEENGFIVLTWGYAGWVRFFGPYPDPSVEAAQKTKMCVTAGDDRVIELWKEAGFNPIPLLETDILIAFQTGMINAFRTTGVMGLASQWFAFTPYMIDLPWAPLIGATIVSKRVWEKIPESTRIDLKQIAVKYGNKIQVEMDRLEKEAIEEMVKRGLVVLTPNKDQVQRWREVMESGYPKLRGTIIPEDWFDQAIEIVKTVRGMSH